MSSASVVRQFVRSVVADHDEDLIGKLVLLANELVINAIVHTGQPFDIDVHVESTSVKVVVSDQSLAPLATPSSAATGATSGRGLWIVATLADSWGWQRTSTGKQVWFRVRDVPAG